MKKRILLSFVGATVLTLGLQSQQTFANTYGARSGRYNTYNTQKSRRHYRSHNNYRYYIGCDETIPAPTPRPDVNPIPKPETKPDLKPTPKPEAKPDLKPIPKPEAKPDIKPTPKPETKPDLKPTPEPETKPDLKPTPNPETKPEVDSSINSFETRVVELTNVERAKQGLPALKIDNELSKVAKLKSQDIQSKGYFDHNSPTYGSPFDMMKQFGISYRSAGENIAKGQRTPEEVVTAWMNSEGHRKNIMGNFTHIGVGYVSTGNVWTQMFISK